MLVTPFLAKLSRQAFDAFLMLHVKNGLKLKLTAFNYHGKFEETFIQNVCINEYVEIMEIMPDRNNYIGT